MNHSTFAPGSADARARAAVRSGFVAVSAASWLVEDTLGTSFPATRAFAPYAHCVAVNDSAS